MLPGAARDSGGTAGVTGFFTDPATITYQFDSADTEFDSTPDTFPPGTYYVHVSSLDPASCESMCQDM